MAPLRPILETFRRTPWVASTPVDGERVDALMPRQIQIGVEGKGPFSQRRLVPLTPAAHEFLYGQAREGAERVVRSLLSPLDGHERSSDLRGISLADSDAGFAVNLMASNIESGYEPDTISSGDRPGFERDFERVAKATQSAKAQNTGWVDFGPRVARQAIAIAQHGAAGGRDAAAELALVGQHELQHSRTKPQAPGVPSNLVWLEEGAAEALAWWPGLTGRTMTKMGVPPIPGHEPDPYTVAPESTASSEYRQRHRGVLSLLELSGVTPYDERGAIDPQAQRRAETILQSDEIERVPRQLARAIARHNHMDPAEVPALTELIAQSGGRSDEIDALRDVVAQRAAGSHSGTA